MCDDFSLMSYLAGAVTVIGFIVVVMCVTAPMMNRIERSEDR